MNVLLECCGNNNIKDITMDNNDKLLLKLLNFAHPIGAPITMELCAIYALLTLKEKIKEEKKNETSNCSGSIHMAMNVFEEKSTLSHGGGWVMYIF